LLKKLKTIWKDQTVTQHQLSWTHTADLLRIQEWKTRQWMKK